MRRLGMSIVIATLMLVSSLQLAVADDIDVNSGSPAQTSSGSVNMLTLPPSDGPVVVRASFDLQDIADINVGAETFEITGVLSLQWNDPRQAFDPAIEGIDEKIFQGNYQFDEISPGWYPQIVLVNESGMFQQSGVLLRVRPDGTSTLIQAIDAVAEAEFDMTFFPFDRHRLELVFETLGFDGKEVQIQVESGRIDARSNEVGIPQWAILEASQAAQERTAAYAGNTGVSSAFVVNVEVKRKPLFMIRLVIMPLMVIVLLSFSVFWMERSALGDRISVSFIGILTGVAYQMVISSDMPPISYVTLMHGFMSFSFFTMCATVVVNLMVGNLDRQGKHEAAHRIDLRCRWAFPLFYFVVLPAMLATAVVVS